MITEQSFTKRIKLLVPKVSDHLVTMLWKTRPFWKPLTDAHIIQLASYLNALADLPTCEPATGHPLWYASGEEFFALCDEVGIHDNKDSRYTLYRATLPNHGSWGLDGLKERLVIYKDLCTVVHSVANDLNCDLVLCVATDSPQILDIPMTDKAQLREEVAH
jgi:hypothetical protein